jgi:hypothetical protein
MITCSVCGHINDSWAAVCENCGPDLSDSLDWGVDYDDDDDFDDDEVIFEDDNDDGTSCDFDDEDDFDDGDFDNSEDLGYYDDSYYD